MADRHNSYALPIGGPAAGAVRRRTRVTNLRPQRAEQRSFTHGRTIVARTKPAFASEGASLPPFERLRLSRRLQGSGAARFQKRRSRHFGRPNQSPNGLQEQFNLKWLLENHNRGQDESLQIGVSQGT